MRTTACLLVGLAAAALLVACEVESLSGCQSNNDCRFGRLCQEGVCVWPPDAGPDVTTGDAGTDAARDADGGGDREIDPGGNAILVVSPDPIDFGSVVPGQSLSREVQLTNVGDGTAFIERVQFREGGVFDVGEEPNDLTLAGGDSVFLVVFANIPPSAQTGASFEDVLIVEAGDDSPSPVFTVATVEEGELCLRSIGPRTLTIEINETSRVEIRVENCGTVDVRVGGFEAESEGTSASLDVRSVPPRGNIIEPGDSAPILLDVLGLDLGRSVFTLTLRYNPEQGGRLVIPLTVDVAGGCGAPPRLVADRDGPSSTTGSLELVYGYQVRVRAPEGGFIEALEIQELPPNSEPIVARVEASGGWLVVPDRTGVYTLLATTLGATGCIGTFDLSLTVQNPPTSFAAWVTWQEPSAPPGPVIDLDLYLARETADGYLWQGDNDVVGPSSQNADWGDPGVFQDNPRYLFDYNDEGWGPEQVRIPAPDPNETLAIGVNAFLVPDGFEAANPRVFIYLEPELFGPYEVDLAQGQFWIVAETQGLELLATYDLIVDGFPAPDLP